MLEIDLLLFRIVSIWERNKALKTIQVSFRSADAIIYFEQPINLMCVHGIVDFFNWQFRLEVGFTVKRLSLRETFSALLIC